MVCLSLLYMHIYKKSVSKVCLKGNDSGKKYLFECSLAHHKHLR